MAQIYDGLDDPARLGTPPDRARGGDAATISTTPEPVPGGHAWVARWELLRAQQERDEASAEIAGAHKMLDLYGYVRDAEDADDDLLEHRVQMVADQSDQARRERDDALAERAAAIRRAEAAEEQAATLACWQSQAEEVLARFRAEHRADARRIARLRRAVGILSGALLVVSAMLVLSSLANLLWRF